MRLVRVGIRLSDLVQGAHQIDLFDDTKEHLSLYAAMDNIRKRYGIKAIGTSAAMYNKSLV
jgi:DNA polymerase-4